MRRLSIVGLSIVEGLLLGPGPAAAQVRSGSYTALGNDGWAGSGPMLPGARCKMVEDDCRS